MHLDLDLDCLQLFLFGLAMSLGIEFTMVYQYYDFIILQFESLTYMQRSLEVILWKAPPLSNVRMFKGTDSVGKFIRKQSNFFRILL